MMSLSRRIKELWVPKDNADYRFSPTIKANEIALSDNNLKMVKSVAHNDRYNICLIDNPLSET